MTQAVLLERLRQTGNPALPVAQHFQDGCDQPLPAPAGSCAAGQLAHNIIEEIHRYFSA